MKKIHPDLVFMDLELLLDGADRNAAAERMKEFKALCEDSEVVVMDKDAVGVIAEVLGR